MKMIKFYAGLAVFIGICAMSFNYIEGHKSTERKETIRQQARKIENLNQQYMSLDGKKRQLEGELEQAESNLKLICRTMRLAEVESPICDHPELESKPPDAEVSPSEVS